MSTTASHKRLVIYRNAAEVNLTAHRLRHSFANVPVTTIQKFLGYKKLNTTMIYARAHDQTVAQDYFTAMHSVEQRLELVSDGIKKLPGKLIGNERLQILALTDQLAEPELSLPARIEIVEQMRSLLTEGIATTFDRFVGQHTGIRCFPTTSAKRSQHDHSLFG
jgi:hypothetical protein